MDNHTLGRSVVLLGWSDDRQTDKNVTYTTGFVFSKNTDRLLVFATLHQLEGMMFANVDEMSRSLRIRAKFFDQNVECVAVFISFDEVRDLMIVSVRINPAQSNDSPFKCISEVVESHDPVYTTQKICTVHHSTIIYQVGEEKEVKIEAAYQYSEGFIPDQNLNGSGLIHFHMPLITKSSAGAPVFDLSSKKLVAIMVQTWYPGTLWPDRRHEVARHLAVPLSALRAFCCQTFPRAPPNTPLDQFVNFVDDQ